MRPDRTAWKSRLIAAAVTAAVLGVGLIVLQRWIAATFAAALILSAIWFAAVAIAGTLIAGRGTRIAVLVTLAVLGIGSVAVGYVTSFRKDRVDEDVVAAGTRAPTDVRVASLRSEPAKPDRTGPVELSSGTVSGADGHAGEGEARIVRTEEGDRVLTLTDFDVDAGPDVNVYLSESTAGIDGAIDLGNLKGEIGDQQYEIPDSADLTRYDDLVLFCIPFTTRIATAELR